MRTRAVERLELEAGLRDALFLRRRPARVRRKPSDRHAIIQLTHALGVVAVAEGVETAYQAEILRELGCHLAQGYHFSRPLPANYLCLSQSESLSAASPALSPALPTPSPASLKIVRNLSA